MGYDAPLPFVPGSWVPASVSGYGAGPAGMKDGWEGLGAVREPPLHDDPFASREGWWVDCLDRGLRGFSQMAYDAPRPFVPGFWVAACAGKTWAGAGMMGYSPSPRVQARGRL